MTRTGSTLIAAVLLAVASAAAVQAAHAPQAHSQDCGPVQAPLQDPANHGCTVQNVDPNATTGLANPDGGFEDLFNGVDFSGYIVMWAEQGGQRTLLHWCGPFYAGSYHIGQTCGSPNNVPGGTVDLIVEDRSLAWDPGCECPSERGLGNWSATLIW